MDSLSRPQVGFTMQHNSSISREQLLRRGLLLQTLTITWVLTEGIVCLAAGVLARSVALIGFGVDSLIETTSAVVVGWRLLREKQGADAESLKIIEERASKIAGSLLMLLALYVTFESGRRLLGFGEKAEESWIGIALTAVAVIGMPLLAKAKMRTAEALNSKSLRIDAVETAACAWLAVTTLIGLVANTLFHWWWADPLAGLVLVPFLIREGLEGLRGEGCHDCGDDK